MAANIVPNSWFASWSEDGTTISVPLASFTDGTTALSAANADGTTGDVRVVLQKILERAYAKQESLASADKPVRMVISKSATTVSTTFSITFTGTTGSLALTAE